MRENLWIYRLLAALLCICIVFSSLGSLTPVSAAVNYNSIDEVQAWNPDKTD